MKTAAQAAPPLRPPRAVVGSQVSFEEEMFGAAFDGRVVRRFWGFVTPHRRQVWIGVAAVLFFTLTQIAIPLVLRYAIDDALVAGDAGLGVLRWIVVAFFAVIGLNYASNFVQELVVGGSREACSSISAARCTGTCSSSRSRSWTGPRWAGSCRGCKATSTRCRSSSRPRFSRSATWCCSSESSPSCSRSTSSSAC